MKETNDLDLFIGIGIFSLIVIYFFAIEPFLILITAPLLIVAFIIYTSGTNLRDEFFKSKKVLIWSVIALIFFNMSFYFFLNKDFTYKYFMFNQDKYVLFGFIFICLALFFNWFNKKIIPISFVQDDDRIVQETMYEDYEYKTLSQNFLHRGIKFRDEKGNKITAKNIDQAEGMLTPTELDITELEMVAINKKDELKFYYEKLIYDFYKVFINDKTLKNLNNEKLLMLYGYNFTFIECKNIDDFKNNLKNQSLLMQKIYYFLEKDMKNPDINISMNIKNIFEDNNNCFELALMTIFLMVRQFMNFPTGDLGKYINTPKDYQFFGALTSLPSDYFDIGSTSVVPSGIAYYYIFYKLHLNNFQIKTEKEIIDRYVIIKE